MKRTILITIALVVGHVSRAQLGSEKGQFSGNFQTMTQFYMQDDDIQANTTQYQRELSSSDAWLFLNYQVSGFKFSLRYDVFNNSPLLDPLNAYTDHGIGFWQATKDIDELNITIGSFYDQFGSGVAFRAFEERLLGLDYAIEGIRLIYRPTPNMQLKGFTGRQKGNKINDNRFETSAAVIKGFNVENHFVISDKISIDGGASIVNRTLDKVDEMGKLVDIVNNYREEDFFIPKYNTYVYNGYAKLNMGNFTLEGEYNYKTAEAIEAFKLVPNGSGDLVPELMFDSLDGVVYSAGLSWSKRKMGKKKKSSIGISTQYRYIKNFQFRTSPFERVQNGLLTYLPALSRQNTYTLLARYQSNAQNLGEQAIQTDVYFTPRKGTTINANFSMTRGLKSSSRENKEKDLFREIFVSVTHKFSRKLKAKFGIQSIFYNQDQYQEIPQAEDVETITPFGEINYKFSKKKSLRWEFQYLKTEQDLGSFFNTILELTVAPKYSFAIGDMINVDPKRPSFTSLADKVLHFPTVYVGYTHHTSTFSLAYKKQVEGVNCTGGICRLEPSFSGVRFTLTTTF
jgi:hypothetical protein